MTAENNTHISPLYTDLYQLAMGQLYFKEGIHETHAVFDYFFRKLPYEGGYAVFTGIQNVLKYIENYRFSDSEKAYLLEQGFEKDFLDYLSNMKLNLTIRSMEEGTLVFPYEPLIVVSGPLIQTQLIETALLNLCNFPTLIATKASRIRRQAGSKTLSEFGMRRAQGTASIAAAEASIIGGFNSTSNVIAGQLFDVPIAGTMAHSYIQSYDNELDAFRKFADVWGEKTILLVDTYDTLNSGLPNAIKVGIELKEKGIELLGIRLDSGDLSYLSKRARKMLDAAGLEYVKIVASNQLDEYLIRSLELQEAPIDIYGVGTSLVTGKPDAALDGVYKLSFAQGKPRVKISENLIKMNFPHEKEVYRYYNEEGKMIADSIALAFEETTPDLMIHPFEPHKSLPLNGFTSEKLLKTVMSEGKRTIEYQRPQEIRKNVLENLKKLPDEHQRFDYPHIYKVGISEALTLMRDDLKNAYLKNARSWQH